MTKCKHWAPEPDCKSCETKFRRIARRIMRVVKEHTGIDVAVKIKRW